MGIKRIKRILHALVDLVNRYQLKSPLVLVQYLMLRKKLNLGYGDFISLDYVNMSKAQKNSLLFTPEYYKYCFKVNPLSKLDILRDKRTVAKRIPHYLGRDLLIADFDKEDCFIEFAKKHTSFYAKRNFRAAGDGTQVFRNINTEKDIKMAYDICKKEGLTIIEEFIEQNSVLSRLYPYIVNTIRIHTYRGKVGVKVVLLPELYLASGGEKNSIHSNKDTYAIFIDLESGRLWDKGFKILKPLGITIYGETCHCDTGTIFGDTTIPYWNKVKEMVIDAASYITELNYIGWDVAITPEGPVIIEGNAISGAMSSYQVKMSMINGGYGVRKEYEEIFNQAN